MILDVCTASRMGGWGDGVMKGTREEDLVILKFDKLYSFPPPNVSAYSTPPSAALLPGVC